MHLVRNLGESERWSEIGDHPAGKLPSILHRRSLVARWAYYFIAPKRRPSQRRLLNSYMAAPRVRIRNAYGIQQKRQRGGGREGLL